METLQNSQIYLYQALTMVYSKMEAAVHELSQQRRAKVMSLDRDERMRVCGSKEEVTYSSTGEATS